jgi:superfamily II DNA or RNA helicase
MLRDSPDIASKAPTPRSSRQGAGRRAHARAVLQRPGPQGWLTTDADEIALRRWRGQTEISAIAALEPSFPVFGTFRVGSGSGSSYEVEIRSLDALANSCGCIDHRVNGLGTCKHIEGVVAALRRQKGLRQAAAEGSARVEAFLDRSGEPRPSLVWPASRSAARGVRDWLLPYLRSDGGLTEDPARIAALIAAWQAAPAKVRAGLRISRHFAPWLERYRRQRSREEARAKFLREVARGKASFDLLRHPLLPYQRDGMMHLAFFERALLADEMGLGKTVQAIAAAELLARRKGVQRVLVVCPASLKAEWEEQIARFADRAARSVFGSRAQRLAAYADPVFYTIINYEQVLVDAEDINATLAPDIIVLDEAQRIKNWQTKTARRVKSLRSPYAFVLTGTPLENRIDEVYSIVQYLDPELVGPLFRFNREFYALDERGRPMDYKNLAELRRRVGQVMLRRRKADVEKELPGRTVTNYFVGMAEEQRKRYEDYKVPAARLIAIAKRRPLLPKEFERLQMLLACMRMICDTPAILDPNCRISPKLEELERVLRDLLEEPDRKVIVFSEWERMLELVRELAAEMGLEAAWHTGSVPQRRRRAEIMRFKQDAACRLFLSTDSGGLGLNLQVASAVVNVDLPWNPARLEQRIARAWRKGQMRPVTIINLVCEHSIEHGMVQLIRAKQDLANAVLDGEGDLASLKMPSGRAAMIERMQALMEAGDRAAGPPVAPAEEGIALELQRRHGDRALLVESRPGADGRVQLLAVLDIGCQALAGEARRLAAAEGGGPVVEVIDRATWQGLQRLQSCGMVRFAQPGRVLHRAPGFAESADADDIRRARAAGLGRQADRVLRMAQVLAVGGFPEEVAPLLAKAIGHAGAARLAGLGELAADASTATPGQLRDLANRKVLPEHALATLDILSTPAAVPSGAELERLLAATAEVLAACNATAAEGAGDRPG